MQNQSQEKLFSSDRSDMTSKVLEFPSQLRTGWDIGTGQKLSWNLKSFRNIIYGGMGGSAIAGDLIRAFFTDQLTIPIAVKRGYELPAYAGKDTLFIASSYSGHTEETLSAVSQAIDKGCTILCITSGGKLGEIAQEKKIPLFTLPTGYPPRTALGFSLGALLNLFTQMGTGTLSAKNIFEISDRMDQLGREWSRPENSENHPFGVAQKLAGKIPLIYADTNRLEPVGFRWKTQFNENSKTHAFFMPVPEMNHNEIIGWEKLEETRTFFPYLMAVFLRTPEEHPRVTLRMNITQELIEKNGGAWIEVKAEGTDFLSRMLYLIYFGDWVSLYLALLYHADPTEIDNINYLKDKLKQKSQSILYSKS